MQLPWNAMNKIRSKVREVVGRDVVDIETFFAFTNSCQQITTHRKIDGYHFVFDSDGNLIDKHCDR